MLHPDETIPHMRDYYFPPYITLAHLFNAPADWAIRDRTLKQFALQYVVKGLAIYTVEGHPYETKTGDLLFHRPNELHSIETVESHPYVCISLVFHYGSSPFPIEQLMKGAHALGNFNNHPIEQKLHQLLVHYRQPGLLHQTLCQGLLSQILAEAAAWNDEFGTPSDMQLQNKAKLVLVKNYIINHYAEGLDYYALETISGLSQNYIIVLFRKTFGMTPTEYLTQVRINKAKELAVQTNMSVSEIAREVGYANVHAFGKMFKKKTGTSITQFCSTLIL
ncbi:helix-turn-helix domain-containing protein [Paenibacillus cremeus]|uniref:Helix-turn-helix domain-containing protein n=2 Tax=Paenibacillus cremeus TaxID=2163881 RepID=A0A559KG04_9BACL|nr:helix-turn-helix domain-containing protein [Paenibacillus cremeus]